jgi:hypothetical protein
MTAEDHIAFFRAWARDIRTSSGSSADADQIEAAVTELEQLRERNALQASALEVAAETLQAAVEAERERCANIIRSKREEMPFSDQRDLCDELVAAIAEKGKTDG